MIQILLTISMILGIVFIPFIVTIIEDLITFKSFQLPIFTLIDYLNGVSILAIFAAISSIIYLIYLLAGILLLYI